VVASTTHRVSDMGIGETILTESRELTEARKVDEYEVELNDEGARVTAWYEIQFKDGDRLNEFMDKVKQGEDAISYVVGNVLEDLMGVWVDVEKVEKGVMEVEEDKYGPTVSYQSRTGLRLELVGSLYVKGWKPKDSKKEGLKADVEHELGSQYGTKPKVVWER